MAEPQQLSPQQPASQPLVASPAQAQAQAQSNSKKRVRVRMLEEGNSADSEDANADIGGGREGEGPGAPAAHDAEVLPHGFQVENFADTKLRYFAAEFVGAFMHTVLTDLFSWTMHYQMSDMFKVMNPGRWPEVSMECHPQGNTSVCTGGITHPIAGAVMPEKWLMRSMLDALSFALCSMSAPGASIMPQFTLLYCLAGVKAWWTFIPSILGQIIGIVGANSLMYFLVKDAVGFQTTIFMMTPEEVENLVEMLLGLKYPNEDVSNEYAFLYAFMSGIMLVFLFTPTVHRSLNLHPLAQNMAFGLAMLVFQTGFGLNGLGSMPNPAQWLCSAVVLRHIGFDTWSRHNHYALWVPFWAPLLGVIVGGLLFRVYMALLYFGRIEVPVIDAKGRRRKTWRSCL